MPEIAKRTDSISQIYLCGTPIMSKNLVLCIDQLKIPKSKYRVL